MQQGKAQRAPAGQDTGSVHVGQLEGDGHARLAARVERRCHSLRTQPGRCTHEIQCHPVLVGVRCPGCRRRRSPSRPLSPVLLCVRAWSAMRRSSSSTLSLDSPPDSPLGQVFLSAARSGAQGPFELCEQVEPQAALAEAGRAGGRL